MFRIRPLLATAAIGVALVACEPSDVDPGSGQPSLAPLSPVASAPASAPAASAPADASASPDSSPAAVSPPPAATPAGSPGEVTEIPFEPGGSAELGGTVTLTEYGPTTQVVVEFNSFQLPATGAVALLKVGSCETPEVQSAGSLEVVDGRLEGTVSIPMNFVMDLPHAVVVFESADATDPLVCIDTPRPE